MTIIEIRSGTLNLANFPLFNFTCNYSHTYLFTPKSIPNPYALFKFKTSWRHISIMSQILKKI